MNLPQLSAGLNKLGSYRDGLLVLASVLYLSGYAIWSVIAWRSELGPIPVLDAQYFVAGAPPLILVGIVVASILALRKQIMEKWPAAFAELSGGKQTLVVLGIVGTYFLAGILVDTYHGPLTSLVFVLLLAITMLAATLFIMLPFEVLVHQAAARRELRSSSRRSGTFARWRAKTDQSYSKFARAQRLLYLVLLPTLAAMFALNAYIQNVYLRLPQALGGARPRWVILDLDKNKLAPATVDLLADQTIPKEQQYFSCRPVKILFSGTGTLIVVIPKHEAGTEQIIEIDRSIVAALRVCRGCGA